MDGSNTWIAIGPSAAAFALRSPGVVYVNECPDDVSGHDLTVFVCGSAERDGPRRLAKNWLKAGAASVLLNWLGAEAEIYH